MLNICLPPLVLKVITLILLTGLHSIGFGETTFIKTNGEPAGTAERSKHREVLSGRHQLNRHCAESFGKGLKITDVRLYEKIATVLYISGCVLLKWKHRDISCIIFSLFEHTSYRQNPGALEHPTVTYSSEGCIHSSLCLLFQWGNSFEESKSMFWGKNRIECESDCPSFFILHPLKQNMGANFDFYWTFLWKRNFS